MFTKRHALLSGILFILLFTSACGGAATEAPSATESPSNDYFPMAPAATEPPATEAPAYSPAQDAPFHNPDSTVPNSGIPQPTREPYDMFFQDYGVNPSIHTDDDHLSTFALDVDTGSYTIMRN
ncbi:MAG TPA: von Willebrand factor type A domain-containing protein, partial [Anaerolineales bacterium]|nr:von Willebrand factor type A domain-containing protein [Anaerolineales bacterium]